MGDSNHDARAPPHATSGTSATSATPTAVATVTVGSMTTLDPALYVPQDLRHSPRRDAFEVDDAINVIEEGEHVSVEDFGLSSTEISMNAPITMGVGVELNGIQPIDAFVADRVSSASSAPAQLSARQPPPTTRDDADDDAMTTDQAIQRAAQSPTTPFRAQSDTNDSSTPAPTPILYPTRRDDKIQQLESHPLVDSIAVDGRNVVCKCGKSVRLNPPWYIIKFEQHIVSRNCTFLRKKRTKRDLEAGKKPKRRRTDSIATSNGNLSEVSASESHRGDTNDDEESEETTLEEPGQASADDSDRDSKNRYRLVTAAYLLRRWSTKEMHSGEQDAAEKPQATCDIEEIITILQALATHPHFNRITPDGRFLECKCSELIILSTAWGLREFYGHVESKSKPLPPGRRKAVNGLASRRPRLGDGAAHRVEQRLIVRETRWRPVSKQTELPCPGLRGERVSVYVSSTSKSTGGSRARRRIAEELYPHYFVSSDKERKVHQKLTTDERLIVRDAVEAEALWFIDHDANAVRSLDCRGTIIVSKGEACCSSCAELRSNASLRISVTVAVGQKRTPESSTDTREASRAITKHRSSGGVFAFLEQEFDMTEEYGRLLRDLFRADVEETSVKNVWFDMAELGISGMFAAHPTFMGLLESMMALKDKERRGVGLQNMAYSDHLDAFMKSVSDISPEACDFFQQRLGGRKQKYLLGIKRRKFHAKVTTTHEHSETSTCEQSTAPADSLQLPSSTNEAVSTTFPVPGESLGHLSFDLANSATMQNLADIQDVDLSSFQAEHPSSAPAPSVMHAATDHDDTDAFLTDENLDVPQEDIDDGSTCQIQEPFLFSSIPVVTPGYMPCRGLRDAKVQAYVVNAVQIIGGSRPKYVIAKELFPEAFDGSRKVKITEKLSNEERGIVLDAIFSECLWRVDRVNNCVRSLRCFRRVDKKRSNGICRACLDLKSIANFRSVLCRAKVPKKVENLKFVPSVYTESDPFMRKLSKNASLRTLYQTMKRVLPEEKKKVVFWLRLAKMGLFGKFRSHPVFEGLIASMVEMKDRERRGVGKQNMLYAKSLDEFMAEFATISMDAFELFSHHFCGRSARSQRVKKRKALTQVYDSAIQQATVTNSLAIGGSSGATESAATSMPLDMTVSQPLTSASVSVSSTGVNVGDSHTVMMPEDILGSARSMSTAEMEENQRFMDHMLDDVRLSVPHDEHEQDEPLEPQTYLDENGVLTTVL